MSVDWGRKMGKFYMIFMLDLLNPFTTTTPLPLGNPSGAALHLSMWFE